MKDVLSVVISVGAGPGLMPPLPGAWAGAKEFAEWATGQGHEVLTFSDEDPDSGRFRAHDIGEAVARYIDSQTLSALFIYFAGHGECWGLEEDYWLLCRTNAQGGDVIDVGRTAKLARRCGIPRVVIISDACRTAGDTLSMALKESAAPILPPRDFGNVHVDIDRFFAVGPGAAALEVQNREKLFNSYGVFTRSLMRALRGEDAKAQETSHDKTRMVVRPRALGMYLEACVPREAAALTKGYPQRPEYTVESDSPLAELGAIPNLKITVDTVLDNGSPVHDSRISLSVYNGPGQWNPVDEKPGYRAEFSAPSGMVYRSEASGVGYNFLAEQPMPMFELKSDLVGRFVATQGPPKLHYEAKGGLKLGGSAPARFGVTRVIDAAGHSHGAAPSAGVFQVVTYDALTGEMASELQEFSAVGQRPQPVAILGKGKEVEKQIAKTAQIHARRTFETRTGLTLLGFPEQRQPQVAGAPGLINEVLFVDGNWQIRGNHSGGVVICLEPDHFVAVPMFKHLVGAVRLNDAGQQTILTDLSYAPAAHTYFDHDLEMLDGLPDLVSGNARDEIDALQLIAATCARNGFFQVAIDESMQLAERMRMLKHHNPVFGVLAAVAYDQVGRADQIEDMMSWFLTKGQSIPFDLVALLGIGRGDVDKLVDRDAGANRPHLQNELGQFVSPSWPMLTQCWARLSSDYLKQFPVLAQARQSLAPGLWTTVVGRAGQDLFDEVQKGQLEWI